MSSSGRNVIVVCPTGIAATFIDGGAMFHCTFNFKTKDFTPETIRYIFTIDIDLKIIDEVFMILSNFIVIMDKLRKIL